MKLKLAKGESCVNADSPLNSLLKGIYFLVEVGKITMLFGVIQYEEISVLRFFLSCLSHGASC